MRPAGSRAVRFRVACSDAAKPLRHRAPADLCGNRRARLRRGRCSGRPRHAARAGRLSHRAADRRGARRAGDGTGALCRRQRHALCRQHGRRQGLCDRTRRRPCTSRAHARRRPAAARRRRVPQRPAVCLGGVEDRALRCDRRSPRQAAGAGAGHRPASFRNPPRREVHRLRARRAAVCRDRRAVQHLPAQRRAWPDPAHAGRRQRARGRRARRAQLGRLRLEPARPGALVHRQRPRPAR